MVSEQNVVWYKVRYKENSSSLAQGLGQFILGNVLDSFPYFLQTQNDNRYPFPHFTSSSPFSALLSLQICLLFKPPSCTLTERGTTHLGGGEAPVGVLLL